MPTIAEIASGDDFSILLAAVGFIDANTDADLASALSNPGALTVFAPTNSAFGFLATDLGFVGDPADTGAVTTFLVTAVGAETLRVVVEYHLLAGINTAADVTAADTLTTLNGLTITPDLPTLIDNEPDAIDPSLIATDIMASNGIVHVIDRVLLPADLPQIASKTFTEIVLNSGAGFDDNGNDFDLLREAVIATDLADTLNDADLDLTVFAPTDAAFVNLSQTLGYHGSDEAGSLGYLLDALRLLSAGDDPAALLKTVLLYHVSGESLQASQVLTGSPIDTLAGIQIGVDGTSLVDGDPDLTNPNLIATDIQATNGVLHVIDNVLIPLDLLASNGANDVDFKIGNDGFNVFYTGADNDFVDGKGGTDLIFSGSGDDVVLGGRGRDLIVAGSGDDTVLGERGRDKILGGEGMDDLSGGRGRDHLSGGHGDDLLEGGRGRDILFGGRGDDTFLFRDHSGRDIVADFQNGHDTIDLSAFGLDSFEDISAHGNRYGTTLRLDGAHITLFGVDAHQIDESDFIL